MDFLHRLHPAPPEGEALLLPSPYATLLLVDGRAVAAGPHQRIHRLAGVAAAMSCTPNVLKAFAGRPAEFVDELAGADRVPLLRLFEEHGAADWPLLLRDLRLSVEITDDERQFEAVWQGILDGRSSSRPDAQRQAERLCRRYAGQSPSRIRRQLRLAAQLAADHAAGRHSPLGEFADQSHYARECRALTGHPPGHWRRVAAARY